MVEKRISLNELHGQAQYFYNFKEQLQVEKYTFAYKNSFYKGNKT